MSDPPACRSSARRPRDTRHTASVPSSPPTVTTLSPTTESTAAIWPGWASTPALALGLPSRGSITTPAERSAAPKTITPGAPSAAPAAAPLSARRRAASAGPSLRSVPRKAMAPANSGAATVRRHVLVPPLKSRSFISSEAVASSSSVDCAVAAASAAADPPGPPDAPCCCAAAPPMPASDGCTQQQAVGVAVCSMRTRGRPTTTPASAEQLRTSISATRRSEPTVTRRAWPSVGSVVQSMPTMSPVCGRARPT
mmetsp:Transcript_16166/g.61238  ORF Transcript_16166/g.61238 Transcript_16166/m.61238 type:complete len:254 (+) Transcript_16166:699-1460(+)